MSSTKRYSVNEIFYSLQGEGFHTGTPAVFVRFSGCNLRCPFCDTRFDTHTMMSAEEIAHEILAVGETSGGRPQTVILTGGEPSLQVDAALLATLRSTLSQDVSSQPRIHIETNGTCPLPEGIDWITCSPKQEGRVVLTHMDELKVVYEGQDLAQYDKYQASHRFLQPCSNRNVAETVAAVKANPRWRLSLQTHIIIGIR